VGAALFHVDGLSKGRTDRQVWRLKNWVKLRFSPVFRRGILQDVRTKSKHFNNQILASQKTHSISITTINNVVMFRDR